MGLSAYKAEPDRWMLQSNGLWEYTTVYTDDLSFTVHGSKDIITLLEEKDKYKLKDKGSVSYHLGCDLFRDDEDMICMAP